MEDPIKKNIKNEKFKEKDKKLTGIISHIKRPKNKAKTGEIEYVNLLLRRGYRSCFDSNLNASNKGCNSPMNDTLLGPIRR